MLRQGAHARREGFLVVLFASVATAIYLQPFRRDLAQPAEDDWTLWAHYEAVANQALAQGEFPQWNPYACGGLPYHAHPFTRALSPLAPLHWLIGTPRSLHVELFLVILLTAVGAYGLARQRFTAEASALAALVTAFGGAMAARIHAGHLALFYLPPILLLLYGQTQWERPRRAIVLCACGWAWALFSGVNYLAACAAIVIGFEALWDAIALRRVQPLAVVAGGVILGGMLSGVKLLPALHFLAAHPRQTTGSDPFATGGIWSALTSRQVADSGGVFSWYEYYAYAGWLTLLVASLALVRMRKNFRAAALLILVLLIASGDFAAWSPWSLLHAVPPFSGMRIPSRILLLAFIPLGQLAGSGLSAIREKMGSGRGGSFVLALPVLVFLDLALAVRPILAASASVPIAEVPHLRKTIGAFQQVRGNAAWMAVAARNNQGILRCVEGMPIHPSPALRAVDDADYRGEVWLLGEGSVRVKQWRPAAIDVEVDSRRSDALVVNQNFYPGWSANLGQVESWYGLLAVRAMPGHLNLVLRYQTPYLWQGLAVTACGLLALGFLLMHSRKCSAPWKQMER